MTEVVGEPLLVVKGLRKQFDGRSVLSDVSFNVYPGDIFGIIGISGSGKTTLLQLLVGFLQSDSGDILYNQGSSSSLTNIPSYCSFNDCSELIQRRIGFAAQHPSFYEELTVTENLSYFGSLYNIPEDKLQENVRNAITLLGLQNEALTLAGELSGGMQKRLDIAIALVHNPRLLLLDEPTADLDIVNRRMIWKLLKTINEHGTTIIISSHFLDEIEQLCSMIAVLHQHRILEQGKAEDLRRLLTVNKEVHLDLKSKNYGMIRKALAKQGLPGALVDERDGMLVAQSPQAEQLLQSILHLVEQYHEEVIDIYVHQPSLNDIFESMVQTI